MLSRTELFRGPVLTVEVDDIDQALAKVEDLDGKTVRPRQEVGEMGFAAYFTDPEGNLTGMWQNTPSGA